MTSPFDLAGRRALVTGGAGGLGSAIVEALAAAGAAVAVHHLGQEDAAAGLVERIERNGGRAVSIDADITDAPQVTRMLDEAVEGLGGLDIVVNNAGIMDERPFLEMPRSSWDAVIAVDLTAVAMVAQEAVPRMVDGGAIINVASQVPLRGGTGVASYAAAKAGVIGLTRALARELGPRIRVAAIAPGPVESPMTAKHAADPEWVAARVGTLIERRFALPEEVAPSVVFLAAASGTLFHGQTLHVNGGGALQ